MRFLLVKDKKVVQVQEGESVFIDDPTLQIDGVYIDNEGKYNVGDIYDVLVPPILSDQFTNPSSILSYENTNKEITSNSGPTIFINKNDALTNIRYRKYIYDILNEAQFNISFSTGQYELLLKPPEVLNNKVQLLQLQERLEIEVLQYFKAEKDVLLAAPAIPVILKPITGKGSVDKRTALAYTSYETPQKLVEAIDTTDPTLWPMLAEFFFVEEFIADPDGTTHKIMIQCLINGVGHIAMLPIERQEWTGNRTYYSMRDPSDLTDPQAVYLAETISAEVGLRNCCLYLQFIVDGEKYYVNDADVRIPILYSKAYRNCAVDHFKFMFDQQPYVTIMPEVFVAGKVIPTVKGTSPDEQLTTLRNGARIYNTFFWIMRYDHDDTSNATGAYMIVASGTTKQEANDLLSAYEVYITT